MNELVVFGGNSEQFALAKEQAKLLQECSMLPQEIQRSLPNCLVVLDMAQRMGVQPAMLARKVYFVRGSVCLGAELVTAAVNAARRPDGGKQWSRLLYRWEGQRGQLSWGCRAVARDLETNEECEGTLITLEMVRAEGWDRDKQDRQGNRLTSKWKTMPEHMLRFRAASFWAREYAPELTMGMATNYELEDAQPSLSAKAVVESIDSGPKDEAKSLDELLEVEAEPIHPELQVLQTPPPPPPPSSPAPAPPQTPPAPSGAVREHAKKIQDLLDQATQPAAESDGRITYSATSAGQTVKGTWDWADPEDDGR